jgi:hypothetical protein
MLGSVARGGKLYLSRQGAIPETTWCKCLKVDMG